MTKTYEDGIRDAIKIVDRWTYVAIVSDAAYTIKNQLENLLKPPPESVFPQSYGK